MPKEDIIEQKGLVTEKLPNAMFRVKLENGHMIIAHSCGKIKKRKITIVVGETVIVEMSMYDLTKGRIITREQTASDEAAAAQYAANRKKGNQSFGKKKR